MIGKLPVVLLSHLQRVHKDQDYIHINRFAQESLRIWSRKSTVVGVACLLDYWLCIDTWVSQSLVLLNVTHIEVQRRRFAKLRILSAASDLAMITVLWGDVAILHYDRLRKIWQGLDR